MTRANWYLQVAERGSAADFDRVISVKRSAPAVLRQELVRPSWKREQVVLGAATDPYQPAEARFGITRGILEALRAVMDGSLAAGRSPVRPPAPLPLEGEPLLLP